MSNLNDAIKEAVKEMIENEEIKADIVDGEIVLSVADQDSEEDED
tara:strand:- start:189 stop:323 length:135 start_codon:yes stop_codon:yes gene_type:complete